MVKLVNRAKMTVASGGAGDITLGTAVDGYQTFADAGVSDTNVVRYTIEDGDDWEIGTGVYTASGTTLVRTVTESSNSDAALTCSGDAIIFVTMAAEDFTGNAVPFWVTEPPTTLDLGTDGTTAVTFTGVAADENSFPIIYSWDGNSGSTVYSDTSLPSQLVSAPTINQATGEVSLIGSSSSSNSGTFNFRMKASDGVKTATAITQVTLSFYYSLASGNVVYDNVSLDAADGTPEDIAFNADGTKIFIVANTANAIKQASLSTAFDISAASSYTTFSTTSQAFQPQGVAFNTDGTKMFMVEKGGDKVYEYSLSTAFDITTLSYNSVYLSLSGQDSNPSGLALSPDGTKMFIAGRTGGDINQYSLTTAFDLSTASYSINYSTSSQESNPFAVIFKPDGTKMFVAGSSGSVHEYSLTTPFSLAAGNVSHSDSFDVSSQEISPTGVKFNSNGSKMYVVGTGSDKVYQYSIGG